MFLFKQKTAYEMRISDWSSDVCSSDLAQSPPRKSSPLAWQRMNGARSLKTRRNSAFAGFMRMGVHIDDHRRPSPSHHRHASRSYREAVQASWRDEMNAVNFLSRSLAAAKLTYALERQEYHPSVLQLHMR